MDLPPLGTAEEFQAMLLELAVAYAPSRFAICQEHGDRLDGRVVGWGLAFPDRALLCPEGEGLPSTFDSPDAALRLHRRLGTMHLLWLDDPPTGDGYH